MTCAATKATILAFGLLALAACTDTDEGGGRGAATTASTATIPSTSSTAPPTTAAPTSTTAMVYDAEALSETFDAATVRVLRDECGDAASGSGFAIDDRHVVTNQHVAGPDVHPIVELRDGRQIESTLIGFDTEADIAVLEVPAGTFDTSVQWAESDTVSEGQPLTVIGYPGLGDYDVLQVSVRSISDSGLIKVSEGIDAGNSGSPAFDESGAVVGVARAVDVATYAIYGVLIPADLARTSVEGFIAAPQSYVPPCDLDEDIGPDDEYVPGSESVGTWLMQLGSVGDDVAQDLIDQQLDRFSEFAPGVRVLQSNDFPATFVTPNRIVFYVGGFESEEAVKAQCAGLGLAYPDDCLARFLTID
jgi:S1-C subfamily serine protease